MVLQSTFTFYTVHMILHSSHLHDGFVAELDKAALAGLRPGVPLCPLSGLWVEEIVPPQSSHHLLRWHEELGLVYSGKSGDAESPAVQACCKANRALLRVYLTRVTPGSEGTGAQLRKSCTVRKKSCTNGPYCN